METAETFVPSLEVSARGRKLHIKVTSKRDGQVHRYAHSLCIVRRDPVHLLERCSRKAGTGMPTLLCKSKDRVPIDPGAYRLTVCTLLRGHDVLRGDVKGPRRLA